MLLIIIFLCFSCSFAQKTLPENKLLWEITTKGKKEKSYLFGSIHTNDKRVFELSDSTYYALYHTDLICLETDIYAMFKDWDTRQEEIKSNFDNKGNLYTGSSKATVTSYGNEDGMPQFLDLYFLQYGLMKNKEFFALESIEDQMNLLEFSFVLPNVSFANKFFKPEEKAIMQYIDGDIELLNRTMKTTLRNSSDFYKKLIVDRNKTMANGIDTLVQKHSAFIVVGAGHLGGEQGVIQLLRQKGHKLRPVLYTVSTQPIKEKVEILNQKKYVFYDTLTNLYATFPGKPFEIEKDDVSLFLIFREMGQGNTYSVEVIEKEGDITVKDIANDYILSPGDTVKKEGILDDGTFYIEGISDTYPEGLAWIRVIESDCYFAIIKAYGGNKFMNSKRPQKFFNEIWFDFNDND